MHANGLGYDFGGDWATESAEHLPSRLEAAPYAACDSAERWCARVRIIPFQFYILLKAGRLIRLTISR